MTTIAAPPGRSAATLLEALVPAGAGSARVLRTGAAIVAGSLLLTLSAKFSIPFVPVPMTLQTLVVLALGMVLGPVAGAGAVLLYLAQGALGLPVFAGSPEKGVGIAYLVGPTGGYLAGFVLAAFATGTLARRRWDRHVVGTVGAMLVGNALIYVPGLLWLGSIVGWDEPVLHYGMTPFLLGDAAKVAMAALALPALWRLVGHRR